MGKQTNHTAPEQPAIKKDRQCFLASILGRPLLRVVSDYQDEIRAKDQAYRFILEQGLLERFQEYCSAENSSRQSNR